MPVSGERRVGIEAQQAVEKAGERVVGARRPRARQAACQSAGSPWQLYGRRHPGVRYSERACPAWSNHNHRRPSPMIKLQPHEQRLTGSWVAQDGKVHGDAICERIKWLLAHDLKKVADSPQWGAWKTLYLDPDDGRYWERTYPQS